MISYKVMFEDNTAVSAAPDDRLQHGSIAFKARDNTVHWMVVECDNEKTAIDVAEQVVKKLWVDTSDSK